METHSSILAWEIPWTEEPGELQSMGSQRVGHNLATFAFFTFFYFTGPKIKEDTEGYQPSHPKVAKEEGRKHLIAIAMNTGSGERDKSPYRMRPFKI